MEKKKKTKKRKEERGEEEEIAREYGGKKVQLKKEKMQGNSQADLEYLGNDVSAHFIDIVCVHS